MDVKCNVLTAINPLLHTSYYRVRIYGQNFDYKIRRDNKKSYERRVYELVDDSSLSLAISKKPTRKRTRTTKGCWLLLVNLLVENLPMLYNFNDLFWEAWHRIKLRKIDCRKGQKQIIL